MTLLLFSGTKYLVTITIFREKATLAFAGFRAGRSSLLVELEFGDVGFLEEALGEKPLEQVENNNKLRDGIERASKPRHIGRWRAFFPLRNSCSLPRSVIGKSERRAFSFQQRLCEDYK